VSESEDQRLNRNLDQVLQELRLVLPGVQVLFAFLLAVPFSSRFADVDGFERDIYFAALLLSAVAVALLMAPSMQHRILFRHEQKPYLVSVASVMTIAGMTALALAIVLSLVLVAHFLFGSAAAWLAGGLSFAAFAVLWYVLPIQRRVKHPHEREPPAG
jgi:O-antigen/teichoic acid export membrane protein